MLLSQRSGGKIHPHETPGHTPASPFQILSFGCLEYARLYFILKGENDNVIVMHIRLQKDHLSNPISPRAVACDCYKGRRRSLNPVKALAGRPKSLQEIAAVGVH